MRKQTVIDVLWMLASALFLINGATIQKYLNQDAFKVIAFIAAAQLVFGLVINPLVRKYQAKRNAKALGEFHRSIHVALTKK